MREALAHSQFLRLDEESDIDKSNAELLQVANDFKLQRDLSYDPTKQRVSLQPLHTVTASIHHRCRLCERQNGAESSMSKSDFGLH